MPLRPDWSPVDGLWPGRMVAGIDEVGRGAWAGPVVAAAVVLPPGLLIPGLADSKLVPESRRIRLDREIRRLALGVGIGWVAASWVDEHGLAAAVRESGVRALAALDDRAYEAVLLDGNQDYLAAALDVPTAAIVKADALAVPVAAASIVAKVARDRYMAMLDRVYPGYAFGLHKGYGTAAHRAALSERGLARTVHRLSYAPLRRLVDDAA